MEILFSTPHQSVAPDQFFVASEDQLIMSRYKPYQVTGVTL
jgi:hypothetical protein